MKHISLKLFFVLLFTANIAVAQEADNWDNQMYIINKVNWGYDSWRFSGELQGRFENNASELQAYFIEGVASFMPSKKWEIVPDFRFTVRPTRVEYRPGFGVFYKQKFVKSQLNHQLKAQYDIESTGYTSYSIRYGMFYNKRFSDHIMGTVFGGGMYEIGELFTDWWGFRAGLIMSYIVDKHHALSLGYMYGAVNTGTKYTNIGIVTLGLTFNLKKEYKYQPARYISF